MHYLIVYRPSDGALLHFKSFEEESQRQALVAGSDLKRVNLGRKDVEIHLLHGERAENLAALRKMFPQYFATPAVFTDPGHCYETHEFSNFALTCDNSLHQHEETWNLHHDPEHGIAWEAD